jgi:hypothetical protein
MKIEFSALIDYRETMNQHLVKYKYIPIHFPIILKYDYDMWALLLKLKSVGNIKTFQLAFETFYLIDNAGSFWCVSVLRALSNI